MGPSATQLLVIATVWSCLVTTHAEGATRALGLPRVLLGPTIGLAVEDQNAGAWALSPLAK